MGPQHVVALRWPALLPCFSSERIARSVRTKSTPATAGGLTSAWAKPTVRGEERCMHVRRLRFTGVICMHPPPAASLARDGGLQIARSSASPPSPPAIPFLDRLAHLDG